MTTDSGDAATTGAAHEPTGTRADTADDASSPYDIGLAADEEETGPKPLDTDLEDEQVRGDS